MQILRDCLTIDVLGPRFHVTLTNLHHVRTDILQTSVDLLAHKFGGHHMDVLDTQRILGRQGCRSSQCIALMCGEHPLISLKSPARFVSE